jgi:hypothetical protein
LKQRFHNLFSDKQPFPQVFLRQLRQITDQVLLVINELRLVSNSSVESVSHPLRSFFDARHPSARRFQEPICVGLVSLLLKLVHFVVKLSLIVEKGILGVLQF